MSLLVDTSVWSLALRRDAPPDMPEVRALRDALAGSEIVATTGVILQELLQGVVPERVQVDTIDALIARLAIGGGHTLLTTDNDFRAASSHISLRLWRAP